MNEQSITTFNWIILVGFFLGLVVWVWLRERKTAVGEREKSFFTGADARGRQIGLLTLTATLLISWIFAKSVQNAANLGQAFGITGGIAYATYWLSFIVAGVVIYKLRQSGFTSLHQFLSSRFGRGAMWLFSLILLFRLWNEIWSNTMVVAQQFGPTGSTAFLTAAWAATALVLAYTIIAGFRGSILTDVVQMVLAIAVLFVILAFVMPKTSVSEVAARGEWSLVGGVDLILVALLQCFSYPFHDPVMTDRGFLTSPKRMLTGFILAGVAGVLFITLFSVIGVYNGLAGIGGNSTLSTAIALGAPVIIMVNVMMLTSASSTLDSTYSSTGKLLAVDLAITRTISRIGLARIAMVMVALLGGAMVHLGPAILKATTVSGTMVIGLTPIFVLWKWRRPGPVSYYGSVLVGLLLGIVYALGATPYGIGEGKYAALLFINATGIALCFGVYILGALIAPSRSTVPTPPAPTA